MIFHTNYIKTFSESLESKKEDFFNLSEFILSTLVEYFFRINIIMKNPKMSNTSA